MLRLNSISRSSKARFSSTEGKHHEEMITNNNVMPLHWLVFLNAAFTGIY